MDKFDDATSSHLASPNRGTIDVAQVAVESRGYWATVLNRLKYDKVTIVCFVFLLLIILSDVFADILSPAELYLTSLLNCLKLIVFSVYIFG